MEAEGALVNFVTGLGVLPDSKWSGEGVRAHLEESLPEHWTLGINPKTNEVFFCNEQNGESTNSHPDESTLRSILGAKVSRSTGKNGINEEVPLLSIENTKTSQPL